MQEAFYTARNMILINYTNEYCTKASQLIDTDGFTFFLNQFFEHLEKNKPELYHWFYRVMDEKNLVHDTKILLKQLLVLDIKDINHEALNNRHLFLDVIESAYNFYRKKERFSVIYTTSETGLQLASFIDTDNAFNQLVLNFYRSIQEKVQGSKNKIYRQLLAGTNASLVLTYYDWDVFKGYEKIKKVPFVNEMMLRTPLIFHPLSNKRKGMFTETKNHIIDEINSIDDMFCFPCKVGKLLTLIYFHKDFLSSVVGLANLFELATYDDLKNEKVSCMMFFGNKEETYEQVYEYDKENDLWVGKVSYADIIEYFGYLKKMALTLHNLCMMSRGYLPIHGAMLNIHLDDGRVKGVVMMGDSGAGKSETIEAMNKLDNGSIVQQDVIFDDMGTMYFDGEKIICYGTEIGAFVRLDDLDSGTAYKDMDRSVFFGPETSNARVVYPCTTHELITEGHKVDYFMYANNYTDKRGMHVIEDVEEFKHICKQGQRFALGTTSEKGISKTYFANPFGPMQNQEVCDKLIDHIFEQFNHLDIKIGEIYTCLGLENKGDNGIQIAARDLLDAIKND